MKTTTVLYLDEVKKHSVLYKSKDPNTAALQNAYIKKDACTKTGGGFANEVTITIETKE